MSAKFKANRCCPWTFVGVMSVVLLLAGSQNLRAVDPAKNRQQAQANAEDAGRGELDKQQPGVRDRDQGAPERRADLDPDGARLIRPPWPRPRHWFLGVRCQYLDTGARLTQVFPNTPAWGVGLERDDVIVAIDGYQIGYVKRHFYEISTELNLRAGPTGWVRLLVQNCRNDQLINVDVQLARLGPGLPRQRFNLPAEGQLDQGEGGGRQRGAEQPRRKPRIADQLQVPK